MQKTTKSGEIMEKNFVMKQCSKCGATVEILKDCNCDKCGIMCCGEPMHTIIPNSVPASFEKHLPTYEVVGDYIVVNVPHVMEEEHYIEFVALKSEKITAKKYFNPTDCAKAVFPYIKGATLFAYCNKHGLWETIVE